MRARVALGCALLVPCVSCADAPDPRDERVARVSEANTSVCPTATVEGVDVSNGQGTIDWAKVAASGRGFAFMKATQGDYNTQTTFHANWTGSKTAGVLRSAYHFFDPTIDGVAQANHFLTVLNGAGGMEPGDLPPMLDIECPTSSSQTTASKNCEYTGNSGWAPTATLVQRVFDWLATVEQATGRKAIIYSYPSWFADVGLTDARLARYPLYIATLSTCASVPPPWTTTVFWQYSFTGTVSGIASQVDLDRFVGTHADLVAFANASAGPSDAGADADAARDASGVDAGTVDAALPDASLDGATNAAAADGSSGCACEAGGARASGGAWLAIAGLALAARRRRARRATLPA